jgi:uncharacterized protein YsxB (DUF464 family)
MISVYIGRAGDRRQIISKGHAGYGAYGEDIVCAAVSSLVNSFAIWLTEKDERGILTLEKCDMEDGLVNLVYQDPSGASKEPLEMVVMGLTAIEKKYFSNLSVNGGEIIF